MSEIIARDIKLQIGTTHILEGASLSATGGEILALLGASGSGKTTLLRCIAGLASPDAGMIQIDGATVFDAQRGTNLAPEARNIGMVFQSYALWPHRTLIDNVTYGLRLRGTAQDEMHRRAQELLERLGLGGLERRYPGQLSGGQQQRVAICRALLYRPSVLLLDEPLSNLDANLRGDARYLIRNLVRDLGLCAILVTHDQAEALAIADHLVYLKGGRVVQSGTPSQVYREPSSFDAANFLGMNNVLEGEIVEHETAPAGIAGGGWRLPGRVMDGAPAVRGRSARAVIRVESIEVHDSAGHGRIPMQLEDSLFMGSTWEHWLRFGTARLKAQGRTHMPPGAVHVRIPESEVWLFQ